MLFKVFTFQLIKMEVLTAVNPYIHGAVLAISVVIETYVFIRL